MDKQYYWRKTEDIEIDLTDLLHGLCKKWKYIAACALVFAVVLGGYGWTKGREGPDAAASDASEGIDLTEEEEQEVVAAVRLKNETGSLEEYLDNSVLMQIDPYHKNKLIMLYCIDHAKRQELMKITESYLNYIINGGAADVLKKSGNSIWKMDKSYLAELVTAYQKTYSLPYQVVAQDTADGSMLSESLFYVEIIGKDAGTARQMARDLQDVLKEYSDEVMETAGRHKLELVSSAESVVTDNGLLAQQRDKNALLSSNKTNLKAMTENFSKVQMAAYRRETGIEENAQEPDADESNLSPVITYIFLGFAGGIFVYCAIFVFYYLYRDTVKSAEEMKMLYLFPFYGEIKLKRKSKKQGGGMQKQQDVYECSKAQMMNRIRLVCKKKGLERMYAASDFLFNEQEKDCLESIAVQLKNWGIEVSVAENVSLNTAVWDDLTETGNVLMVCRIGTTTHRMIDDVMNFYLENGIAVLGAVVFSQNE